MDFLGGHNLVISIDLGWSETNLDSTAAAWCEENGKPLWTAPGDRTDILVFLKRFHGKRALVLLDIPIYGTDGLSRQRPFRQLDRALLAFGIPLLPSYKAGDYGDRIAGDIRSGFPDFEVVESYPYAVLRFLWAARHEPECLSRPLKPVVDVSSFARDWPPKYKRSRNKSERVRHMFSVLDTLNLFLDIGNTDELLPSDSMGSKQLDSLCDIYDALLGLVVGLEMASGSKWFFPAKVEDDSAMMPLLLDENLRVRWFEVCSDLSAGRKKSRSRVRRTTSVVESDRKASPRLRNVEIKARVLDFIESGRTASEIAGEAPQVLNQVDTYFNVSRGRLKLREDEYGCEIIYYERPDSKGPKRCDYDRFPVESQEGLKDILTSALGVKAVVRKQRLVYIHDNVRIHLDTVEGLGHFLELEAVAHEGTGPSECRSRVKDLLSKFKVKKPDLVKGSYCDLLEQRQSDPDGST